MKKNIWGYQDFFEENSRVCDKIRKKNWGTKKFLGGVFFYVGVAKKLLHFRFLTKNRRKKFHGLTKIIKKNGGI